MRIKDCIVVYRGDQKNSLNFVAQRLWYEIFPATLFYLTRTHKTNVEFNTGSLFWQTNKVQRCMTLTRYTPARRRKCTHFIHRKWMMMDDSSRSMSTQAKYYRKIEIGLSVCVCHGHWKTQTNRMYWISFGQSFSFFYFIIRSAQFVVVATFEAMKKIGSSVLGIFWCVFVIRLSRTSIVRMERVDNYCAARFS